MECDEEEGSYICWNFEGYDVQNFDQMIVDARELMKSLRRAYPHRLNMGVGPIETHIFKNVMVGSLKREPTKKRSLFIRGK